MPESDFVGSKEHELLVAANTALFELRERLVLLKLPTDRIADARLALANLENLIRFRHKHEEEFSEFSKSV